MDPLPATRRLRARRAFTLVELAVILLMVSILGTIAIVAVSASRDRNELDQARASIVAVTTAQLDFAARYGTFSAWPADVRVPDGPALTNGPSASIQAVSIALASDGTLGLASGNGSRCVLRSVQPVIKGGRTSVDREVDAHEGCSGASALPGDAVLTTPTSRVP